MKTAEEWVNLWCADRDVTINDYFKAIQLDAREELLAELEQVRKDRNEARIWLANRPSETMYSLATERASKLQKMIILTEQGRDNWKRLANRMRTQLHCNCKFGNTCPKCELLAEFGL